MGPALMRSRAPKGCKSRRQPLYPALGAPQDDKAAHLKHGQIVPRLITGRLPGCWFSICKALWAQVNRFSEFLVESLTPLAPTVLSLSYAGLWEECLTFHQKALSWVSPALAIHFLSKYTNYNYVKIFIYM